MLLYTIEIKNYRSLEHIKLDHLQHFNVLIGRNNAGKSSVFLALSQLGLVLQGPSMPVEVLTDRDPSRSVEIRLTFKPTSQERETLIDLLVAAGLNSNHRNKLVRSPFFRMIQFSFRSAVGNPHLMHLQETRLLAQDSKWTTIQRMVGEEHVTNPQHKFIALGAASKEADTALPSHVLDIEGSSHTYEINLAPYHFTTGNPLDQVRLWTLLPNCQIHKRGEYLIG